MADKHRPRRGSMAFSPRKRANRQHGRVKSWPATDSDEVKVQGFAGWKAGMTHILMRDLNPYSPSAGAELRTAVTVVEVPPIRVLAVRGYHMTPYGLQTAGESWADSDSLDENVVGLFPRLANRSKAESLPEGYKPAKRAGRQPKPKNHDADANFNSLKDMVLEEVRILVATQPDLGTSILIAAGGVVVAWLAGVRAKFFLLSALTMVALLPIAISFLKPYQKERILTFLNPDRDPLGAGYQIIQSKIAIGSGGLFGKGFLNGSQSYLDFLPEKHTDFIFTLFSEEFGFFGSVFILLLYSVILSRIVKIGHQTRSNFGKLYCYGFAGAFFVYVVVNMGMVLGLLPIVGAPLPIMSYGGSSMLAIMMGLGIAMSCKIYKDAPVN